MNTLAHIRSETFENLVVVTIDGEIDISNASEIAIHLRNAVTNSNAGLLVDLTATSYLDSAGINLLFDFDARLQDRQQQMHLVVAPESPVARILSIVGLDGAMPFHATRNQALRALGVTSPAPVDEKNEADEARADSEERRHHGTLEDGSRLPD